eukprot:Rmarinus@m.3208
MEAVWRNIAQFLGAKNKNLAPAILVVHVNIAVYSFCYWMNQPVLLFMNKALGADAITFGYLTSFFSLVQLIGGPIFGHVCDAHGARLALVVSQVGSALSYLLLGMSRSTTTLFLSRLPTVTMHAMHAAQTIAAVFSSESARAEALGRLSLSYAVGMILGGPFGGIISSWMLQRGFSEVEAYGCVALVAASVSAAAVPACFTFLPALHHQEDSPVSSNQKGVAVPPRRRACKSDSSSDSVIDTDIGSVDARASSIGGGGEDWGRDTTPEGAHGGGCSDRGSSSCRGEAAAAATADSCRSNPEGSMSPLGARGGVRVALRLGFAALHRSWEVFRRKELFPVLSFQLGVFLALGIYSSSVSLMIQERFALDSGSLGLFQSLSGVVAIVTNTFVVGFLTRRFLPDDVLWYGAGTAAASLLATSFATSLLWFLISSTLLACASSVVYTVASSVATNASATGDTGKVLGLAHAFRSAAGLVTPPISTALYQSYGFSTVVLTSAAATSLCLILSNVRSPNTKPTYTPGPRQ